MSLFRFVFGYLLPFIVWDEYSIDNDGEIMANHEGEMLPKGYSHYYATFYGIGWGLIGRGVYLFCGKVHEHRFI